MGRWREGDTQWKKGQGSKRQRCRGGKSREVKRHKDKEGDTDKTETQREEC